MIYEHFESHDGCFRLTLPGGTLTAKTTYTENGRKTETSTRRAYVLIIAV